MGDKNFMMNSGSYLIMQGLIPAWVLVKYLLLRVSVRMSKIAIFRQLGISLGEYDPKSIRKATQRLFLESYFDIAIGVFMNIIAFMQSESLQDFKSFFATRDDFINSAITIVLAILIFLFPIWMLKQIWRHRRDLLDEEFQEEFSWLFEDLRVDNIRVALYQFFFVLRRLYYAIILTFFSANTVL